MKDDLSELLHHRALSPADQNGRLEKCLVEMSSKSNHLAQPAICRLSPLDLQISFSVLDKHYFDSCLEKTLRELGHTLSFRISRRMTRSGGATVTRRERGNPRVQHQIVIAADLLHQSFTHRDVWKVCGLDCPDMRTALVRILEHECVHLAEMLVWDKSSCSAARFKSIANRLFGHRASNHRLLTHLQAAAQQHGLRPGDRVGFEFAGQSFTGIINRIHRRATVLVASPSGQRYSDGQSYRKFYVPLGQLIRL